MSRYKMKAIDYNLMNTVIKLLRDRLPDVMKSYNVINPIKVIPSYPRDITAMHKPSIIIRKVDAEQSRIAMNNYIGQILEDGCYSDVSGIRHDIMLQLDVVANGNIDAMITQSMVMEDIFNNIIISEKASFQLYDFTGNPNNPTEMGVVTMMNTPYATNIPDGEDRPNSNSDYIIAIRQTFTIIQEVIPRQDYVDLSKWIKQSITITNN